MWQWSCDGMIEGLGNGMMLIMWTNNKRAGTRGTILPPLHLPVWSHCVQLTALHWLAVYPTVAVNSNVLIGHSGSLQSLDRDRLWWEATKAPTEYKIGQLVREPQKRRFLRKIKEPDHHRASHILAPIIQKGGPDVKALFHAKWYVTKHHSPENRISQNLPSFGVPLIHPSRDVSWNTSS